MNTVVIVGRTRMNGGHVCVGGHDLDCNFRAVRLLDRFGDHWPHDSPFKVGDAWKMRYELKISARPPHVEDVCVMEKQRIGRAKDLKSLVLKYGRPWTGDPGTLYEGTVRCTTRGTAYIPAKGRLPRCSTGYWVPDGELERRDSVEKVRFAWIAGDEFMRFSWVGTEVPPPRIMKGSLVRVSLSRAFSSDTAPEGFYVQISGVIESKASL